MKKIKELYCLKLNFMPDDEWHRCIESDIDSCKVLLVRDRESTEIRENAKYYKDFFDDIKENPDNYCFVDFSGYYKSSDYRVRKTFLCYKEKVDKLWSESGDVQSKNYTKMDFSLGLAHCYLTEKRYEYRSIAKKERFRFYRNVEYFYGILNYRTNDLVYCDVFNEAKEKLNSSLDLPENRNSAFIQAPTPPPDYILNNLKLSSQADYIDKCHTQHNKEAYESIRKRLEGHIVITNHQIDLNKYFNIENPLIITLNDLMNAALDIEGVKFKSHAMISVLKQAYSLGYKRTNSKGRKFQNNIQKIVVPAIEKESKLELASQICKIENDLDKYNGVMKQIDMFYENNKHGLDAIRDVSCITLLFKERNKIDRVAEIKRTNIYSLFMETKEYFNNLDNKEKERFVICEGQKDIGMYVFTNLTRYEQYKTYDAIKELLKEFDENTEDFWWLKDDCPYNFDDGNVLAFYITLLYIQYYYRTVDFRGSIIDRDILTTRDDKDYKVEFINKYTEVTNRYDDLRHSWKEYREKREANEIQYEEEPAEIIEEQMEMELGTYSVPEEEPDEELENVEFDVNEIEDENQLQFEELSLDEIN